MEYAIWLSSQSEKRAFYLKIKKACMSANEKTTDVFSFLEQTYGMKVEPSEDGMITANYTITDQKKYLVFLLKFS